MAGLKFLFRYPRGSLLAFTLSFMGCLSPQFPTDSPTPPDTGDRWFVSGSARSHDREVATRLARGRALGELALRWGVMVESDLRRTVQETGDEIDSRITLRDRISTAGLLEHCSISFKSWDGEIARVTIAFDLRRARKTLGQQVERLEAEVRATASRDVLGLEARELLKRCHTLRRQAVVLDSDLEGCTTHLLKIEAELIDRVLKPRYGLTFEARGDVPAEVARALGDTHHSQEERSRPMLPVPLWGESRRVTIAGRRRWITELESPALRAVETRVRASGATEEAAWRACAAEFRNRVLGGPPL